MPAWLDTNDDVIAVSSTDMTLAAAQAFNSAITQKIVGPPAGLRVSGRAGLDGVHTFHRKTSGDGTDISHYALIESLDGFKKKLFGDIDAKAQVQIVSGPGFEWPAASGDYLSLSLAAQSKWLGIFNARNSAITYPVLTRTKDDKKQVTISNAADVQSALEAGVVAVRAILDPAQAAKENVQQASTIAAAQTAADAYLGS